MLKRPDGTTAGMKASLQSAGLGPAEMVAIGQPGVGARYGRSILLDRRGAVARDAGRRRLPGQSGKSSFQAKPFNCAATPFSEARCNLPFVMRAGLKLQETREM